MYIIQKLLQKLRINVWLSSWGFFYFQESPKEAMLQKISTLRRDRQQHPQNYLQTKNEFHPYEVSDYSANRSFSHQMLNENGNPSDNELAMIHKRQLILSTIEDLKRNLEDQSIELCGLNDDE